MKQLSMNEKFDLYVLPVPEAGCWLWEGPADGNGYGHINKGRRPVLAHRFAWERFKGSIPAGLCVCHKCDTPSCVNPEHLFLGTHGENMRDKDRKGRANHATGERHASAKLRAEQVLSIRSDPRLLRLIADEYGEPHHYPRTP